MSLFPDSPPSSPIDFHHPRGGDQNDCPKFQNCLETARRIQQARVRAWDAQELAEQLRRQQIWDTDKRDIVLGSLKLDRLKQKLEAGSHGIVGAVDANAMAKSLDAGGKACFP